MVRFVFFHSKPRKQRFFAEFFKIQRGIPPSDAHSWPMNCDIQRVCTSKCHDRKPGQLFHLFVSIPELTPQRLFCRDVFLPLLCTDTELMSSDSSTSITSDKLMDILHRLLGNIEVSRGVSEGNVSNIALQ